MYNCHSHVIECRVVDSTQVPVSDSTPQLAQASSQVCPCIQVLDGTIIILFMFPFLHIAFEVTW